MRGFIDDTLNGAVECLRRNRLNPRSCAASSMTPHHPVFLHPHRRSQSAFMRGFIDDATIKRGLMVGFCLNPRSCAASSMTIIVVVILVAVAVVSIRVHARLHR